MYKILAMQNIKVAYRDLGKIRKNLVNILNINRIFPKISIGGKLQVSSIDFENIRM